MTAPPLPLSVDDRIAAWDAGLSAVRGVLRAQGLREVSTPVRLPAVAIEPYIEPIASTGGVLATSPELPMKQLLMAGAGPIFQIAHVLRAAERGERHAEEFHLIEWYRPDHRDLSRLCRDTELLVQAVFGAVGMHAPPQRWQTHGMLDLIARTTTVALRGDENATELAAALAPVRPDLVPRLPDVAPLAPDVADLAAWTAFFTSWCDADLDPWLAGVTDGVHVVEFPVALAALSAVDARQTTRQAGGALAFRVESYVAGMELANGYRELRDAAVQRRRFEAVQGLRGALGTPRLPMPEAFLRQLEASPLPPTVGCALGLDRLLALACGTRRIADVALPLPWSAPGV